MRNVPILFPKKAATTFTAETGMGVRYQWHGRWSLLAQVDYPYLKPTFKNLATTEIVAGERRADAEVT